VSFSSVDRTTDVYTADLKQVSQRSVQQTIPAKDQSDAEQIIERLRSDRLPVCEDPAASPAPVPVPSATPGTTKSPAALPNTATPSSPAPAPSSSVPSSPLPSQAPEPGVDCRWPR
jgi:protein phosphatase